MKLIISVNYRSNSHAIQQVNKIIKNNDDFKFICVDNDPIDNSLEEFVEKIADDRVVYSKNNNNLGYFPAAFKELDNINTDKFQYCIICNADINFPKLSSIDGSNYVNKDRVGAVSPQIISSINLNNQNPYLLKRPPRKKFIFWRLIYSNYFLCRIFYLFVNLIKPFKKNRLLFHKEHKDGLNIYATQGSVFILTSNFLRTKFYRKSIPMLYAEEIFIAEELKSRHLSIVYDGSIKFEHDEHASTGKSLSYFKFNKTKSAIKFILREYYR